jgi:hypothetical protein
MLLSIINLSFIATLTSGSLAPTTFPVHASYDDSGVTGGNGDFLPLTSFDFSLGGASFSRNNIAQGGQAIILFGQLDQVTAAFFGPLLPANSPVTDIAFGFGGPAVIGYLDLERNFGSGTFILTSVPEPSMFSPLAAALPLLLFLGRKRVRKTNWQLPAACARSAQTLCRRSTEAAPHAGFVSPIKY